MHSNINSDQPPKISPQANLRDTAVEQIKHYIQSHRLEPGQRLPTVRDLAEHFGISRDAIWRALKQMQKEAWLDLQPNKRYTISERVYTHILQSLRVRAIFSGKKFIYFTGFRRLADALVKECRYHNIDLEIELLPLGETPTAKIWDNCDLLMIDSDSSGNFLATCERFARPVIGLDANYSERYRANIVTDHHLGGRIAAEAMLQSGEKQTNIVYHAGSEGNPRISARIDGFRQAWLEGGRPADSLSLLPIEWSRSSFEVALNVKQYLENNPLHHSYFVTDGRLATNFLDVLSYMGIKVPEEAKLIGYDGAQKGGLTDPPMTTIQQDMDQIASIAVNRIRKIVSGEEDMALERVPPLFIKRDSF
jgi:hypothetical protein